MCSLLHSLLRARYTGITRYILSPRGNRIPETRNYTQRRHVTSRGQNQMSTQARSKDMEIVNPSQAT